MSKKNLLNEIQKRIKQAKFVIKHTNKCPEYNKIISHWKGQIWGLKSFREWIKKNES